MLEKLVFIKEKKELKIRMQKLVDIYRLPEKDFIPIRLLANFFKYTIGISRIFDRMDGTKGHSQVIDLLTIDILNIHHLPHPFHGDYVHIGGYKSIHRHRTYLYGPY